MGRRKSGEPKSEQPAPRPAKPKVPFSIMCMNCRFPLTITNIKRVASYHRSGRMNPEEALCRRCHERGYIDVDMVLIADEIISLCTPASEVKYPRDGRGMPKRERTCTGCGVTGFSVWWWRHTVCGTRCATTGVRMNERPVGLSNVYTCSTCGWDGNVSWCPVCRSDRCVKRVPPPELHEAAKSTTREEWNDKTTTR